MGAEGLPGAASEGAGAGQFSIEEGGCIIDLGQGHTERSPGGKLRTPERRRRCVSHPSATLGVSERRACRVLSQPRSTQRFIPRRPVAEERLRGEIVKLPKRYGRYGYRRITALLRRQDFRVNHKRVERIWRQEGLKIPQNQPKRGRRWLNDGPCVRLRPTHRHDVRSYDLMADRTHDGHPIKSLTVIDEFSRESLAILVERRLNSDDVLGYLPISLSGTDLQNASNQTMARSSPRWWYRARWND
jgi:hypothetical protein